MLPGVWVKMASCSLRSPHMSGDSSCACLSSNAHHVYFPSYGMTCFPLCRTAAGSGLARTQGPYAFLHLYQCLADWRTLKTGSLMKQTLQIVAWSAPYAFHPLPPTFSNLPSWSDETVGRCWPALARLWVLVWLVAGRWALVVKTDREQWEL